MVLFIKTSHKKLLNNKNLPLFNKVLSIDKNILSLILDFNNIINYSVTYVNWNYKDIIIDILNKKLNKEN